MRVTRREFIRRLSALGGVAAAGPALRALAATPGPRAPLDVVIVGAGLAGLCAAYELERRGHRVTILEADARHVGVRARTMRFADGLYGEFGAMRIPARHDITRHYARELGITLRKFILSNPQAYYFLRGERRRIADAAKLNRLYALRENERNKTPDDLWSDSVVKMLNSLSDAEKKDLTADALTTDKVRALDQQSLQQLCEAAGLSDEAIELLAVTQGAETLLPTAATEHLREELLEVWTQGFDEIVGGTDRLAAAFASRLHAKPQLGCEVVRMTQDAGRRRAAAIYRQSGAERRVEGDFLLCTLPCPVLTRIVVEPELPGPKARAIRQLNYDSSTKVLVVTRRRFWESDDGIFGGGSFADLPTTSTYYPSDMRRRKTLVYRAAPA